MLVLQGDGSEPEPENHTECGLTMWKMWRSEGECFRSLLLPVFE